MTRRADASSSSSHAVDLRDVGVIQRGERIALRAQNAQPIVVGGEQLRQQLDRHVPLKLRIARAIHLAHAAGADRLADLVQTRRAPGDSVTVSLP